MSETATQHFAPAATAQADTDGFAVASMVLSLLWLYGIGSVLAIVFATLAQRRIREGGGLVTGGGMATAGMVLGIAGAVLAVFVIAEFASSEAGGGYSTY